MKVPERMVAYVSGEAKKTRDGKVNSLRRNGRDAYGIAGSQKKKKENKKQLKAKRQLTAKKHRSPFSKLTTAEKEELSRAAKKGFLTMDGRTSGHRSLSSLCSSEALKASRVATAHRKWCAEREKPNIILYKASGRHSLTVLDHVVVDLSPLSFEDLSAYGGTCDAAADDCMLKWKKEILAAASSAGMELKTTEDTEECSVNAVNEDLKPVDISTLAEIYTGKLRDHRPISQRPFISMGFFVGERTNAKAMARELAQLWELPESEDPIETFEICNGGKHGKNSPVKKIAPLAHERKRTQRRRPRDDLQELLNRYR